MIEIIKATDRHFNDFQWLQTYWLFSFSSYFDPHNIQFGALRVFNDDVVQPGMGFPTHPHEEMEIITIVLAGEMTHKDSMGNKSVIKAGDVQRMSAGTGLTHSEFNLAQNPDTCIRVQGKCLQICPALNPPMIKKTFRLRNGKIRFFRLPPVKIYLVRYHSIQMPPFIGVILTRINHLSLRLSKAVGFSFILQMENC